MMAKSIHSEWSILAVSELAKIKLVVFIGTSKENNIVEQNLIPVLPRGHKDLIS